MDTANRTPDDRDAKRIFAAAQQAGLKKIDYLLTTHFHGDHFGALPALAKLIPIGMYLDHGESIELSRPQRRRGVQGLCRTGRRASQDRQGRATSIPLKGVDIEVIMSAGQRDHQAAEGRGREERRRARTSKSTARSRTPTTTRASASCSNSASSTSSTWAT